MSAKALRRVCDSREQAAPWQPSNSALSASDRHDFAVSQGLDIANWGLAKESPVATLALPESASRTRPPDEEDLDVMIISPCVSRRIADTNKRWKATACGKGSLRPPVAVRAVSGLPITRRRQIRRQNYAPIVSTTFPIC
jgi:hypothetical protein